MRAGRGQVSVVWSERGPLKSLSVKREGKFGSQISPTVHVGWALTCSECSTILIPFISRSLPPQIIYYFNCHLIITLKFIFLCFVINIRKKNIFLVRWAGCFGGLILGFKRGPLWPKLDFPFPSKIFFYYCSLNSILKDKVYHSNYFILSKCCHFYYLFIF